MVKCSVPKCEREAFLIFMGQAICGECYSFYYEEKQKEKFEEFKEVMEKNDGQNTGN